ncbi:hypothetical protein CHL67_00740 [Prosthecochloris sp. GSB1]|uniref:DUF4878 domain-containing protein n=1 Tax=Prosthecochloris sp. GSB1 TaxID=281093 RepID=UPI000B8CA423|nr:DUF4878 domain-containing protein [Prosthecochloris sp. GSB1]ASQ89640.1 hypothetical protein CHL67_00740 [Prosthecochloris sp. GSB1]
MKHTVLPRLLLLSLFFLASCGDSPRSVARKFTENLAKGRTTEAKKYATEATGEMIDFASKLGAMPVKPDFRFVYVDRTVEGDRATVVYRESKDGPEEQIELVRVDGKWKVHMQPTK